MVDIVLLNAVQGRVWRAALASSAFSSHPSTRTRHRAGEDIVHNFIIHVVRPDVLGKAGMRLRRVVSPCSRSVLRNHRQPSRLAMALRFSRRQDAHIEAILSLSPGC